MSQIINISQAYSSVMPTAPPASRTDAPRLVADDYYGDTAEFSKASLRRAVELSSLRIATTAAIRAEIEEGTYETRERIEGTVDRLLDVIG